MVIDRDKLPDDPAQLKELLLQLSDEYEKELKDEKSRYQLLEEKYLTLQRHFFGKRSEKLTAEDKEQMLLFNEAEEGSDDEGDKDETDTLTEYTRVKSFTRKKPGRRHLPEDLPRNEIVHDLSEKDKLCPCCGETRPCIGKETSEELDIVPAKIQVNKHIRLKYGPCKCDEFLNNNIPEVKTASMPSRMIPKSIVSPGLLAYVITSKFVDSLPFYRQSTMFKRIDLEISRATLCNWAILAAEKCSKLLDLMTKDIRGGPVIRMDETTLQVLKEPGRPAESKSYMWVIAGYHDEKPVILYNYHTGRTAEIPYAFLEGYKGYLQTDGYKGYNKSGSLPGIVHVGCFAHARRYFHEASRLSKKSKSAYRGLDFIRKLYTVENELRESGISGEKFVADRRKQAGPVLDEFHNWLQTKHEAYPPESKLGKAITYTLNEWEKLVHYLDIDFLTPDNNLVENAIRPFVVGRKNWLFSNTPRGAHSSALLYSLVETAKANNLEPYSYLRYLFTRLPGTSSEEEMRELLPYCLNSKAIDSG